MEMTKMGQQRGQTAPLAATRQGYEGYGPAPLCGGLALILLAAGAYFVVTGTSAASGVVTVDPATAFTSLGKTCVVVAELHESESRRVKESDGSGSGSTVDSCEDSVSYTFTIGGKGAEYESRTSVTSRNSEGAPFGAFGQTPSDDMCASTGGGRTAYQGYLPTTAVDWAPEECPDGPGSCTGGTPFVCVGFCAIGTQVSCWEPAAAVFDLADLSWAKCGNPECVKLVDPAYERASTLDESEFAVMNGYLLLAFGGIVTCCAACFLYKIHKNKGQPMSAAAAAGPGAGG